MTEALDVDYTLEVQRGIMQMDDDRYRQGGTINLFEWLISSSSWRGCRPMRTIWERWQSRTREGLMPAKEMVLIMTMRSSNRLRADGSWWCDPITDESGTAMAPKSVDVIESVVLFRLLTLYPPSYLIGIFTHSKFSIHNFKWVKITQNWQTGYQRFWNFPN